MFLGSASISVEGGSNMLSQLLGGELSVWVIDWNLLGIAIESDWDGLAATSLKISVISSSKESLWVHFVHEPVESIATWMNGVRSLLALSLAKLSSATLIFSATVPLSAGLILDLVLFGRGAFQVLDHLLHALAGILLSHLGSLLVGLLGDFGQGLELLVHFLEVRSGSLDSLSVLLLAPSDEVFNCLSPVVSHSSDLVLVNGDRKGGGRRDQRSNGELHLLLLLFYKLIIKRQKYISNDMYY